MLDSILERPSLEGTQAESNLNGTARLSVASCQTGFYRLNGAGEADAGPSSEATFFGLASVQQSPFTEVREGRATLRSRGQHCSGVSARKLACLG